VELSLRIQHLFHLSDHGSNTQLNTLYLVSSLPTRFGKRLDVVLTLQFVGNLDQLTVI